MNILKYLGYGWLILVVAIIANGTVKLIGITTWYDYILNISSVGVKEATQALHILDTLFLFILYPGLFGLIVYIAVFVELR